MILSAVAYFCFGATLTSGLCYEFPTYHMVVLYVSIAVFALFVLGISLLHSFHSPDAIPLFATSIPFALGAITGAALSLVSQIDKYMLYVAGGFLVIFAVSSVILAWQYFSKGRKCFQINKNEKTKECVFQSFGDKTVCFTDEGCGAVRVRLDQIQKDLVGTVWKEGDHEKYPRLEWEQEGMVKHWTSHNEWITYRVKAATDISEAQKDVLNLKYDVFFGDDLIGSIFVHLPEGKRAVLSLKTIMEDKIWTFTLSDLRMPTNVR